MSVEQLTNEQKRTIMINPKIKIGAISLTPTDSNIVIIAKRNCQFCDKQISVPCFSRSEANNCPDFKEK